MGKLALDAINARLDALETSAFGRPRRRLSKTEVALQEGITPRTVMRRVKDGTLPPSDNIINGRHFWWSDSLERHRGRNRARADTAAARAARNPALRPRKPAQPASEI
jgi:hypothetical protein